MDQGAVGDVSAPLVSVVITNYNTGRYLPETLDSALAQTHRPIEVIVVDDGSTDDTVIRIEPYLDRIRFFQRSHGGLAAARNQGIAAARGDYVALLDADDLWLPEKLSVQVEIAKRSPASGMVACDGLEFGAPTSRPYLLSGPAASALRRTGCSEVTGDFHRAFIDHVGLRCPAQTLIPRAVLDHIGPFGNFEAQDFDYYLRLSARYPVTFHAHALVRWRDREDSMSGRRSRRDLTWTRQRLVVLRSHARRDAQRHPSAIARQLVFSRAEAAFHYAALGDRRHAFRALRMLLARQPWPPAALPFLVAAVAPHAARHAYRLWSRYGRG
jgi:glycosyltransferase involved in cell wall biosynthesis